MSRTGAVLDPAGIGISARPQYQSQPVVAFDGTGFLVAWTDLRSNSTRDVYAARVSGSGVVVDPSGIGISSGDNTYRGVASVTSDGANFLVTWSEVRDHAGKLDEDLFAARVSPSGAVLDPSDITRTAPASSSPYSP